MQVHSPAGYPPASNLDLLLSAKIIFLPVTVSELGRREAPAVCDTNADVLYRLAEGSANDLSHAWPVHPVMHSLRLCLLVA